MNEDEKKILRKKVYLKGQAIKLIRAEQRGLRHQLNLYELKVDLESRMDQDFDQQLSSQIDAVQFLIESMSGSHENDLGARSLDPCGSTLTTSGAPSLSGGDRSEQSG